MTTSTTTEARLGARLYGDADWYDAEALLTTDERTVLARLREFLDTEAKPLLAEYWERAEFPEQLAQPLILRQLADSERRLFDIYVIIHLD